MRVLIEIPSAFKQYLNNQDVVEVVGISVEETLDYLSNSTQKSNKEYLTKMVLS